MSYTITLTEEQKSIVTQALAKYAEFTLGQRIDERATAKKLVVAINKLGKYNTTVDLTK